MIKFNNILSYLIILFVFFSMGATVANAKDNGENLKKDDGAILILSSYNPDVKRMNGFVSEFETTLLSNNSKLEILIEDLNFKGLEESQHWKPRMQQLIEKYKSQNIKAIILLGQEAWATFISINGQDLNVPFFGCIASETGIYIDDLKSYKYPESFDFSVVASSSGHAGGALNRYDIAKNIELIKTIYPNVINIGFISDNTYGGVSLQSAFIAEMKKESGISYTLIDAREDMSSLEDAIVNLPAGSVILIGTWRTGNVGQYLMSSTLEKIASLTDKPFFTISGLGMESVAVGGAIPTYDNKAADIANQIVKYYQGDKDAVKFIEPKTEYRFDNTKLKQYGINTYQLPYNSIVVDGVEAQLSTYRQYIYVGSIVFVILILIFIYILFLFLKNKKLKDILKNRESELILAKEAAEESNNLKTAFLANMSHEIRTPLNAIVGFSNVLSDEDMSKKEREEFGSIIRSNSDLLLTLINDILDISKLQSTNISFVYENTDVVSVMRDVINTTNYRNTCGLDIKIDTEFDSYILYTDRNRFSQILINLMTNAYKFTQKGSISLSFHVENENCVFSVTDTGIGIPLNLHCRVFDRFEKMNDFAQGSGLGLAICRQIVTLFEGEIHIDPNYTEGARFVFTIPIKQKDI